MRILVVDDEALIRRTLSRALAEHQVAMAESCAEARALLADGHFDLVLSDMHLPDGVGTDLHAWIEGANIEIGSFVLMTGGGIVSTRPGVELLAKPFGRQAVVELLERAGKQPRRPSRAK